jgi:hypothetical protein
LLQIRNIVFFSHLSQKCDAELTTLALNYAPFSAAGQRPCSPFSDAGKVLQDPIPGPPLKPAAQHGKLREHIKRAIE